MKKYLPILLLFTCLSPVSAQADEARQKALKAIEAAIEAMGGDKYRQATTYHASGMYFIFSKGRKSFAKYWEWVTYDPIRWRFQLDEGKRQFVQIYNLEEGKAWTLEGEKKVEPVPEEDIEDFKESAKADVHLLLRHRVNEEGMNLYYYGPNDVAGSGEFEAVEFLDSSNKSVVVFFDVNTRLPHKLETHNTDKMGLRHKLEEEYYNWHNIEGVLAPLRYDVYRDGEMSQQRHLDSLTFSPVIPPDHFLEPKITKK